MTAVATGPRAAAATTVPRHAWLLVARLSVREAINRRVVSAAASLSAVFLALFALGTRLLQSDADTVSAVAASILASLGLYAVHFLGAFVALMVSVGAISAEIESGALHALLARPLSRRAYVLGRWAGLTFLVVTYVVTLGAAVLLIARLLADHTAASPGRALGLMALEAVLLVTIGLLGSTRLSTLANGVTLFVLFSMAWIAGFIELIGHVTDNAAMSQLGVAVSLVLPTDALWRAASYHSQSSLVLALSASGGGGFDGVPLFGSTSIAPALLAWTLLYVVGALLLAARLFRRRDL